MRRFAISDIHGCVRTLEALLEQIAFSSADELFLLGDYIDRGPDSKGVIDLILKLKAEGYRLHCLRGNHEALLLNSIGGLTEDHELWLQNGGDMTMSSFGLSSIDSLHLISPKYTEFLNQLEWYFETEGYILAHAGLDFRTAQPLEARQALIWIRNWYEQINREWLKGRIIVHGHTPVPRPLIVNQLKKLDKVPALDIDAGCVFKGNYFKYLCAFDLDNRQLNFQENIETDA
ncbi:MAG: serine/threonine protein phosphatase [Lewinellaceae bacterium]|nr:serine/threonine protein phosphatase [Phaeodactylibacter sp.]MCB0613505.1 serine/threonine protein phosphatase [Phaeodactylibacter sp.]MCB9347363.1 serine/threonine protein phosphatase [Lewinellaceae bacterium]